MKNKMALLLMRTALWLYDRRGAGATIAAYHLQAAIDAETGAKPLQPGEEIDSEVLHRFGWGGSA